MTTYTSRIIPADTDTDSDIISIRHDGTEVDRVLATPSTIRSTYTEALAGEGWDDLAGADDEVAPREVTAWFQPGEDTRVLLTSASVDEDGHRVEHGWLGDGIAVREDATLDDAEVALQLAGWELDGTWTPSDQCHGVTVVRAGLRDAGLA